MGRRKSHHRSDFFLGNMEEAYIQQHRKEKTPSDEKKKSKTRFEEKLISREEAERSSGLLPLWQKESNKKRKKHKTHREKPDFALPTEESAKKPEARPENAPRIIPIVKLSDNPEAIPGYRKNKEKAQGEKKVPVLKGIKNPEAMPGVPKEKKIVKPQVKKEELPPVEEKKPEKVLNPFDPKELEEIFHKEEEEEKDFLEQSEEALQKAVEKSRAWIKKQAEEEADPNASTALRLSRTLTKKALGKAQKTLSPLKEKLEKKKKKRAVPKAEKTKEDPFLASPEHRAKQDKIRESLDGMYEVYGDKKQGPKGLKKQDIIRYAVLFVCIFGFVSAGAFVFTKLYDYYRSYVVYSGLQELVLSEDFFQDEYLKKTTASAISKTPLSILNGEVTREEEEQGVFSEAQQNLVNKIGQLKNINEDTVGWIKIDGTVVNYPVVWSELKNYYLHRDFYGKNLSGGTIYVDERNDKEITLNRNTVIYGHNMTDGSMFASIHDFVNASTFSSAKIEITTEEGVFIYTPFSVHESDAYDNYFETNFVSDEDFVNFCEQMKFISIYETDFEFDKDSRIITLSTCGKDEREKNDRFAVHAVLTKVIR